VRQKPEGEKEENRGALKNANTEPGSQDLKHGIA
jgi:hypothetical protein